MYGKRRTGGLSPSRPSKRSKLSVDQKEALFDNALANEITDRTTPGHRSYDAPFHLAMAGDPDSFKLYSDLRRGIFKSKVRKTLKEIDRSNRLMRVRPWDEQHHGYVYRRPGTSDDEMVPAPVVGFGRPPMRWDMNPIDDIHGNPQPPRIVTGKRYT